MDIKSNTLIRLLNFLAALIPTLKQLWKNSKQVQSFSEEELYQYSITRMLESKDKKAEKLLKSIGVGLSNYGFFDAPDFLEFAILEKIDFDITYTFDKKFELISYPALDEDATETANCYVYAYDQRKENIRKLGKPALGLSPPLFS